MTATAPERGFLNDAIITNVARADTSRFRHSDIKTTAKPEWQTQFSLEASSKVDFLLSLQTNSPMHIEKRLGGGVLICVMSSDVSTKPITKSPVDTFLSHLESLGIVSMVDEAIDLVISFFDDALSSDEIGQCKAALVRADVASMDVAVSLAFLSMTLVEKDRLAISRRSFYNRTQTHLLSLYSQPDTERLLKGLR